MGLTRVTSAMVPAAPPPVTHRTACRPLLPLFVEPEFNGEPFHTGLS